MIHKTVASILTSVLLVLLFSALLALMDIKLSFVGYLVLGFVCGVFTALNEDNKYAKKFFDFFSLYADKMVIKNKVLFSDLALGAKFKFENHEDVWVKIDIDPKEGCIAKWDNALQASGWVGQPVCSLNDNGIDQYVILVK